MVVLVRHGESEWNAADRFAGWADIGLTERGRDEARSVGRALREVGLVPDVVHTSLLARARDTADLLLEACGRPHGPVLRTERLNERHYGALQGLSRVHAVEVHGAEQLGRWRRGIHDRPPVGPDGRGESLADVRHRLLPYLDEELLPALAEGQLVVVVSHGNTLRMLRQLLEGLTDRATSALNMPTGSYHLVDRSAAVLRQVSRPAPAFP